ncbi:MAG: serine hydrolase domain-containing protein, partial [Rhodococcus sp. (in: high G+C Gram-positive bacteria)]
MRSYLLVAAVIIGATTALIGCSTLQRAVEIQSDLDGLTRSGVVGSIATLDDGTTTAVMTSGVPNRTNGDSIGKNDRVRIGSVTKTFTASLVLQLVAETKIDLDAPIEQYLPGLLHGSGIDGRGIDGSGIDGSAITVRQLLQHRSGLPEFAGEPGADEWIAANEDRTLTPSAAVAIALGKPAQFVPGTSFV